MVIIFFLVILYVVDYLNCFGEINDIDVRVVAFNIVDDNDESVLIRLS